MTNDVTLENDGLTLKDGIIRLSPERVARWDRLYAKSPGDRKMRDTIVEYATKRRGLTFEFWSRSRGIWFGDPFIMLPEAIARDLGVPVSELDKVWAETWEAVGPTLDADPDYQKLS